MNMMSKKKSSSFAEIVERIHYLFYELSCVHTLSSVNYLVFWIIEKATLLAPFLLLILDGTRWEGANSIICRLNVLSYFNGADDSFAVCALIFVCIFQLFVGFLCLNLFQNGSLSAFKGWIISFIFPFNFQIFTQVIVSFTFYTFNAFGGTFKYSKSKGIPNDLLTPFDSMHIALSVLLAITFAECIFVDILYSLLYQEEKLSLWCLNMWQLRIVELFTKILIYTEFIFDYENNYALIVGLFLILLFAIKIIMNFRSSLSYNPISMIAELFYDCCSLLLNCLIVLCIAFGSRSFMEQYHYSMAIPIYAAIICFIRYLSNLRTFDDINFKNERGALEFIRRVLMLCHMKDDKGLVELFGLLTLHKQSCASLNCICKVLLERSQIDEAKKPFAHLNFNAYEKVDTIPERISKSWRLNALKLLIENLGTQLNKSPELCLAIAEISFYYFGNHYIALTYIESLRSRNHSIIYDQFIQNLRHIIDLGMANISDDSSAIFGAIIFQEKYNEFLTCIDESCEDQVSFWSTLLNEKPDLEVLMKYGKDLYESRNKFMQLVKEINRICSNHTEFLVKFGLYSRLIMHDNVSASSAFQKILWAADNINLGLLYDGRSFSLFRKDSQVMMIVVCLDQANFFQITEMNNQVTSYLGYKREELIRFSATKLMQSSIAEQHQEFVQRFFQDMNSSTLGRERLRFLRHQDGYLVPCKTTKKIVPSLSNGLQGVMLFYLDTMSSVFTSQKMYPTRSKIGAFLFDTKDRLLDVTKDVYDLLKINKDIVQTIKSNIPMSSLFPELKNDPAVERMKRPQGAVIQYNECQIGLDMTLEEDRPESTQTQQKKLLWTKLVYERYGTTEVIFLFISFILKKAVKDYAPLPECKNLVFEREREHGSKTLLTSPYISIKRKSNLNSKDELKEDLIAFSDHMSVQSSMASINTGEHTITSTQRFDLYSQDIQIAATTKETPTLIRRLSSLLVVFVIITIILVSVEAQQFYDETADLKIRFQMIEYFQIRFELIIFLAISPRSYDTYRRSNVPSTFVTYCARTKIRADRATQYSVKITRYFTHFKLNYDYESVGISYGTDNYAASFNYAFIKFINEVLSFTSLNDYNVAKSCIGNMTSPICKENQLALDYCSDNGFYSLRVLEQNLSNMIMKDLLDHARSGEKILYIIISICVAIFSIVSFFISWLIVLVIKDKSHVMEIFAEMTDEEIKKIIKNANSLHINNVTFNVKHVNECNGDEGKYWQTLIHTFKLKKKTSGEHEKEEIKEKEEEISKVGSDGVVKIENNINGKDQNEENDKSNNFDNVEAASKNEVGENDMEAKEVKKEAMQNDIQGTTTVSNEEKKVIKRKILGQIDIALRNTTLCKIGIVMIVLICYGISSTYFNYYLHDFNERTTNFFYDLSKRNVYGAIAIGVIREAVRLQNKALLLNNPLQNGELYLKDVLDEMQRVEAKVANYFLTGERYIFKKYFRLTEKFDTDEFCTYVDSYQIGQSGPCNTSYGGPINQGLTVGMAFFLSTNAVYASKILASNLSDNNVANTLSVDPALTFPGTKVMTYLQPTLELQLMAYREDAVNFYELIELIIVSKAVCFVIAFLAVYFFIILGLIAVLKNEIWLIQGILNMIPLCVLENNAEVQHLLWLRKHLS